MPLAIELAASRTRAFSTAELAEMLDERFRLLVGGRRARVERHQTMRTTLDWSYELCGTDERIVFDSLSVFPTWFDLQAARAVAADGAISGLDAVDLLARLVDRSLVEHDVGPDGASRYRLLETMRAYGREHLSHAGRSDDVRSRHANHVKAVMVVLAPQTAGPDERRAQLIAERLVPDRYTAFAWFIEQHDWDGAYCVAVPLIAHDVRPEYEMLTALRDAIVASTRNHRAGSRGSTCSATGSRVRVTSSCAVHGRRSIANRRGQPIAGTCRGTCTWSVRTSASARRPSCSRRPSARTPTSPRCATSHRSACATR